MSSGTAPEKRGQFTALAAHFSLRREAILLAWRKAADADPAQTTVHSLTHGQFQDHIPEVLDAFEHKLRSVPGGTEARAAQQETEDEEVKHGLHRWQQGYRLTELIHEWGHLERCLLHELENFAAQPPGLEREHQTEATRLLVTMVVEAISESAAQYERMQQAEAAGRVEDLVRALASVNEIEQRRSNLIHEAVHDINSNVFGVTLAAKLLVNPATAEAERNQVSTLLRQGVSSVSAMLCELTALARLEAGQDRRNIEPFDAAALLKELAGLNGTLAQERGLFLKTSGPATLPVNGDPRCVQRLCQNLVFNALKYTESGGVTLSWGAERETWWLIVKDTGPGILAGPSAPVAEGLTDATASARESDEKTAALEHKTSRVLTPPAGNTATQARPAHLVGDGIGLSIVKRLCELLDGSLEMSSSAGTGTTFRVVLPQHYPTR